MMIIVWYLDVLYLDNVFNIECFIMMHGYIYKMIACQLIMMVLFDVNVYEVFKHDR